MKRAVVLMVIIAWGCTLVADCAEVGNRPSIRYLPLDAPEGISQAVIVDDMPLVHTRQLLPLDREGNLVGEGSAQQQIEQVLDNLEAVLKDSGSAMDKLVRVHVYALSTATVEAFRQQLAKRLGRQVRPAMTAVLTPLPHRKALIAVDAVAGAEYGGREPMLKRCAAIGGNASRADAAVIPNGPNSGVVYLSGQPDEGGLTESAVSRAMSTLMGNLKRLKLSPRDVVQVKVFLRPMTSWEEVLREVERFFPDQITPPVVCVEWLASMPVEIEMIAHYRLPIEAQKTVEYYTPPEVRPSPIFSKVAILQTNRQIIYTSGIYAREPSRGEPQGLMVFQRLKEVLEQAGSGMGQLVKATYYVSDDDAARWVDRTRPRFLHPDCPPAASKVMVHGVGQSGRTMTVDMIAVGIPSK